ncbi:hypothetical protein [Pseudobacteriovorax antillogorgiicola]|uniref:Capsular polysaccharide transport system permease protein n=1 Tax=Pseudobacteriovorax antillogorgiicola TaxID=1513793 RepID=A0A1Y6C0S1_9BACT|nr:hypothetical protein [Pseudobacteriovorax antillogorgiicola]TCS50634.1 capsular polysaccharide transport system permease protein [Pseudobacteriovorax antillogorgiicola]SMF39509.1 capsular polysaccharide transport system permease protein [Pseudobacteriovorax antillogorgiicola]
MKISEPRKFRKLRRNPKLFLKDSRAKQLYEEHKAKGTHRRMLQHQFAYWVAIPFVICALYLTIFAADRFASKAELIVKRVNGAESLNLGALSLIGGSSNSAADAMLVQEYILSMAMMDHLHEKIALLDHFRSEKVDFVFRLGSNTSREESYAYYLNRVRVDFDELSGVMTIEAQGFEPSYAQKIVQVISSESEAFLNRINHDLAAEQMEFVEEEVVRAQDNLRAAKQNMIAFQSKHNIVQPEEQSKAVVGVVNELTASKTKLEAELKTLLGYMNPKAPEVEALRNRISAINEQLAGENQGFTSTGSGSQSLGKLTAEYHDLVLNFNFAQDAYKTALVSLEKTRVESTQKKKFLVVVSRAFKPEDATHPKVFYNLVTIFFGLLVLYGVVTLSIEIVRENRA